MWSGVKPISQIDALLTSAPAAINARTSSAEPSSEATLSKVALLPGATMLISKPVLAWILIKFCTIDSQELKRPHGREGPPPPPAAPPVDLGPQIFLCTFQSLC